MQNFVSVASIALIFFIRKYLFVPSFRPQDAPAAVQPPDIEQLEKPQAYDRREHKLSRSAADTQIGAKQYPLRQLRAMSIAAEHWMGVL